MAKVGDMELKGEELKDFLKNNFDNKKKLHSKCVRMTNEVFDTVLSYSKGLRKPCSYDEEFNQKFENLVLDFKNSIPEREQIKKKLDEEIQKKMKILDKVEQRINQLESLEFSLDYLRDNILNIMDKAKSVTDISEEKS